jgi:hypothetical protein
MSESAPDCNPNPSGSALAPTHLPSAEEGLGYQPPRLDALKVHEATTARNLAYVLVFMLFISIVAQYVTLAVLVWLNRSEAVPNFEHLFNSWLPVIAGLTSSAVTYYLTKERR